VEILLRDEANKSEAPVDFAQVHDHILLVVRILQLYDRGWLVVELAISTRTFVPVDARHIDQHVDQLRAYLVLLHVNGWRVSRNVYLTDNIEQERLLDPALLDENVEHRGHKRDLGQQLLDHFRQCFVDGVVVDAGHLEGDAHIGAELRKLTAHVLLDHVETVHFRLVCVKMFLVDFVDEHFIGDAWLQLVRLND